MSIVVTRSYGVGNAVQAIPALRILQEQKQDFVVMVDNDTVRELLAPEFTVVSNERRGREIKIYDTWLDFFPRGKCQPVGCKNSFSNRTSAPACYGMNEVKTNVGIVNDFLGKHCAAPSCELIPKKGERRARGRAGLVGIHPGCQSGDNGVWLRKRWPAEYWVKLVNDLMDEGKTVRIYGHKPDDQRILAVLYSELGITVEWCVDLPVRRAAFSAGECEWFVSNDSGMSHLALAGGCQKVIVMYGPTSPTKNTHGGALAVVNKVCPFQPCYTDRFSVDGKRCHDNQCMKVIEPGQILGAIHA